MKKIGFKLLLSGVALAACAATLSTTTYAWYVTNSEANASAIQGSTASAAASGNILVAKNKDATGAEPGSFMQNISFAGDTTNIKVPTNGLNPVSKDTEALKPESVTDLGWHGVDLSPVAAADAYMSFDIWVLSTEETTVNVELTTKNTTLVDATGAALTGDALTTKVADLQQTCYNASGAPVAQGDPFVVDAVEALRMEVTQGATSTVYSVKTLSNTYTSPTGFTAATATTDAQAYYKALLGKDPDGGISVDDPTATLTSITVEKNTATKLSFKVWLEGTDKMCFDSCAGQTFTFDFKFSINNSGAGAGA